MKIWCDDPDQEDLDGEFLSAEEMLDVPITANTSLQGHIKAPLRVSLKYRRVRPVAFKAGPIIVVNEHVRERLRAAKCEIEFHPVDVKDKKTREVLQYYFPNVLSELDCLDRTRSAYREVGRYAEDISKLVLKTGCASLDLFRLSWTSPCLFVVSDELARRLAEVGRLGLKFVDVESYVDPAII